MSDANEIAGGGWIRVASDILGGCLDLVWEGEPGPISPRAQLGPARSPGPRDWPALLGHGLFARAEWARGAVSSGFLTALSTLNRPHAEITVRILGPADELTTRVFFAGSAGPGVAVNQVDDAVQLRWPVTIADLAALVETGFLRWVRRTPGESLEALFHPEAALAFFGIADLLRLRDAEARRVDASADRDFTVEEIRSFLSGQESGEGPGDLRLYAALATGSTPTRKGEAFELLLDDLVRGGQLQPTPNGFRPSGVLLAFCDSARRPLLALHWRKLETDAGAAPAFESRVAVILGGGPILVMDALGDGLLVRIPSGAQLAEDFRAALGPSTVASGPEKRTSTEPEIPVLRTKHGTTRRPSMRSCTRCATPVRPGTRFCTHCGTRVGAAAGDPS